MARTFAIEEDAGARVALAGGGDQNHLLARAFREGGGDGDKGIDTGSVGAPGDEQRHRRGRHEAQSQIMQRHAPAPPTSATRKRMPPA